MRQMIRVTQKRGMREERGRDAGGQNEAGVMCQGRWLRRVPRLLDISANELGKVGKQTGLLPQVRQSSFLLFPLHTGNAHRPLAQRTLTRLRPSGSIRGTLPKWLTTVEQLESSLGGRYIQITGNIQVVLSSQLIGLHPETILEHPVTSLHDPKW